MDSVGMLAAPAAGAAFNQHMHHSSYRERLLEHVFVGEMMRRLWVKGITRLEVLKPQVDASGYDIVLDANSVIRHVQLKASHHGSSTRVIKANLRLAAKPSGCIVWVIFDPATLQMGSFLWFGGAPGQPLPDIGDFPVARHTKGNAQGVKAERPNIRLIPKPAFDLVLDMDRLLSRLFGDFAEANVS